MRVLVTGGAGFIGHNIALHLIREGYDVVVVDNVERSSEHVLKKLSEHGVPVVRADVRSFSRYGSFEVVVHAAAYVSVEESVREPLKYIENNVLGTARVGYECAMRTLKLIYLSSAAVYGEPVRIPVDEEHPTHPLSPYGLSKLQGEEVLKNFARVYGLKFVVLRLFNVYGPWQNPAYAGVITNFIERVLRDEPPIIYGDGEQTRDFIYVKDVARVVKFFVKNNVFNNETYNIGSGTPTSIRELAGTIIKLFNKNLSPIYTSPRLGDIRHSIADISKIKKLTNFQPTPLEEGLRSTLKEMLS
ncbi:MAG: SDR family NAD(P)-dependent oxidoreductase [Zestosphaera sp.]